uniref:U4/U6 small nuclear ribonucleoprotein Prp31 n=1 Tax=Parastrongyloides trichosuri TaxID=131310 RepID=A0A0N4Z1Y2_PARTI
MSLAEELLADLEDEENEFSEEENEKVNEESMDTSVPDNPIVKYDRVTDIAKLSNSENFKTQISKMDEMLALKEIPKLMTPLEIDPQYQLVVKLSELASEIDTEINIIYKFVKDKYQKRFPELETLIMVPLEYLACVKLLGNDIKTKGQNKDLLSGVLAPSNCIVVSVTASTSEGQELTSDELDIIREACDMAEMLQGTRNRMQQYVEMRMNLIAPNIAAILGSGSTAMIVSQAGGLAQLSKMPGCNILLLGQQKKNLIGLSSVSALRHTGFIYYHPMVQSLPPDHRRKVAKIIASKVVLAARVDFQHESRNGAYGLRFKEEIQKKIDKLLEPPPLKNIKPLPKPIDKASKKRGGRRVRKMKEALGMTDLRKNTNRMGFGDIQEDINQEYMGHSAGMNATGSSGTGRIRAAVVDNKTRVKMSQKLQKQLDIPRFSGGLSSIRTKATAGTASSISFTPVQGLEIVNPTAREEVKKDDNSGYFSSISNFQFVKPSLPK